MTNPHKNVGEAITQLRAMFIRHERYAALEDEFDRLLYQRRAAMEAGSVAEAPGLALIGGSGSGKSTALRWLFRRHEELKPLSADFEQADVASFLVPSPATLKQVGTSCLQGLGYPLRRAATAGYIWSLVQNSLYRRRILFLHLDEAQDLHINQNRSEQQAVVNTLKSLMQNADWPTGLILSGMPSLKFLLNQDAQLARRISVLHFRPLDAAIDLKSASTLVTTYADTARMSVDTAILTPEFTRRLLHAAAYEFGIVVELIIGAIEEAMIRQRVAFGCREFAAAFRRRSACIDDLNPFLRHDYTAVDPRLVLTDAADVGHEIAMKAHA